MLEEKITELQSGKKKQPVCRIDLAMSYFIPDSFFDSDMDKIHFFRLMESIENEDDLNYSYEELTLEHEKIPQEVETFYLLLRAKLYFQKLGIIEVKKSLGKYIFTFGAQVKKEQVAKFLDTDTQRHVVLISMQKSQIPVSAFPDDQSMLQYICRFDMQ